METTKQLTDSQKRALELIEKLASMGKIELADAIQLIIAIYENEKEIVYIPYQNPYPYPDPQPWITQPWTTEPYTTRPNSVPWWDNQILCGQANTAQADPHKPETPLYSYAISGTQKSPWNMDFTGWIGK